MKIFSCIFIGLTLTFAATTIANAQGFVRSPANQTVKLKVHSSQHAAQLVKNRFGGKVLKVSKQKVNGHNGYKVKLLKKSGHVVSVLVDAQSGRIIGG